MSDIDDQIDLLIERLRQLPLPDEIVNLNINNQVQVENNLINIPVEMANQFQEFYLKTIPEFDGNPANVATFLSSCNLVMNQFYDRNNPNLYLNHFLLNFVQSKLTGQARAIVSTKNITSWEDLKNVIASNFTDQRDDTSLLSELLTLKQRTNEDAMSFSNRCRQIEQLLISNLNINEADENTRLVKRQIYTQQTLKAFLGGLRNPLGMVVRSTNPANIEAALKFIISEENYQYRDSFSNKSKNQSPHNNNYNQQKFFERSHVPKFQPVQFQRPFSNFNAPRPQYNPPRPFPFRSDIPAVPHWRFQQPFRQNNFPRQFNPPSARVNYPQPMEVDPSTRTRTSRNNPPRSHNTRIPRKLDFISEELHNIDHMSPSEQYDAQSGNFCRAGPSSETQ